MIAHYLHVIFEEVRKQKSAERLKEKRLAKYREGGYHIASNGEAMYEYARWCKEHKIEVQNIMEIGANYAQDAEVLQKEFSISDCDVYVFEAHPDIYSAIKKLHRFNAYNYAVTNYSGIACFNICRVESDNTGVSSLRISKEFDTKRIEVSAVRMDKFIEEHNLSEIGFLKLDVEGCSWEVLDGFGDKLRIVKVLQIEAEHIERWEGEKLWDDIYQKLGENGFEMVLFERKFTQSDSLWVRRDLL